MRAEKVQRWCPTCRYFFKRYGQNSCQLADWSTIVLGAGPDPEVLAWLKEVRVGGDESTRIADDADGCPRWRPYGDR